MNNIILHIGFPKTATTFLQQQVFPKLKLNYLRNPTVSELVGIEGKALVSEESIIIKPYDTVSIKDQVVNNISNIKRFFPNAKIIIGIRNNSSWMESIYAQYIHEGGFLNKEAFIKKYCELDNIQDFTIKELQRHNFDILFYNLEDIKINHSKEIKRICDFIGEKVPKYSNTKYNVSLSGKSLELLRKINIITKNKLNNKYIRCLGLTPRLILQKLSFIKNRDRI